MVKKEQSKQSKQKMKMKMKMEKSEEERFHPLNPNDSSFMDSKNITLSNWLDSPSTSTATNNLDSPSTSTATNNLDSPSTSTATNNLVPSSTAEDLRYQTHFMDLPDEFINDIMSRLPPIEKEWFPFLSMAMMKSFYKNPRVVDEAIVKCWDPLHLVIDCYRFKNNLIVLHPSDFETDHLSAMEFRWLSIGAYVKGLMDFHRDSLAGLELKGCCMLLTKPFNSLRILTLLKVKVLLVEGLVNNLPLLEHLFLKKSILPTCLIIDAETSALRLLAMDRCRCHIEGVMQDMVVPFCQTYIRLGNLVTFSYVGTVSNRFVVVAPRLEEASLSIGEYQNGGFNFGPVLTGLLLSLQSVKKLTLCKVCVRNIKRAKGCLQPLETPFSKLEELWINTPLEEEVMTQLCSILLNAPKLKRLYVDIAKATHHQTDNHWESVEMTFESLIYLQVSSHGGFKRVFHLLSFILENSPKLLNAKIMMEPGQLNDGKVLLKDAIADLSKAFTLVKVEVVDD